MVHVPLLSIVHEKMNYGLHNDKMDSIYSTVDNVGYVSLETRRPMEESCEYNILERSYVSINLHDVVCCYANVYP